MKQFSRGWKQNIEKTLTFCIIFLMNKMKQKKNAIDTEVSEWFDIIFNPVNVDGNIRKREVLDCQIDLFDRMILEYDHIHKH